MRCIAHRGFAGVSPENTIPAVRHAVEAGADTVEVDVRRCGTGELVVIHDSTLDRVTDMTGPVAERSLAQIRATRVLDTDARVPTLEEVFEAVPAEVRLNVELKEQDIAAGVLEIAATHDNPVLLSSFDKQALREARSAGATQLGYLIAADTGTEIERARELGATAIHPHLDASSAAFVERAHEAGLAVNGWTARSVADATAFVEAGVDGIIADAPAYCQE